jgi:hypothetical protein
MEIRPSSTLLQNLQIENLISYLELTGWKPARTSNQRWLVLEGASDIDDEPLEIVLPQDSSAPDFKIYLANAINLLCAVTEERPENVVKKIRFFDRDVLSIRNLETDEQDSITLDLAAKQVSRLKQLVSYAASSEREPKPHFNFVLSIGRRMVERYRFGHTFPGSFGFTIEAPIVSKPVQLPLLPEDMERVVIMPLERRVMERIVRGLLATQRATKERDLQKLVREYSSGFNANMCDAIVKMSKERAMPLEYTVLWSPKLGPSDDIEDPGVIRLSEISYQYLDDASRELRELEPEYVVIRGMVTDLSSKGDPLGSSDIPRSIAIKWTNRPDRERPVKVIISLEREDYVAAHEAHLKWRTVEVTGAIERVGTLWRLSDPQDFKVIW